MAPWLVSSCCRSGRRAASSRKIARRGRRGQLYALDVLYDARYRAPVNPYDASALSPEDHDALRQVCAELQDREVVLNLRALGPVVLGPNTVAMGPIVLRGEVFGTCLRYVLIRSVVLQPSGDRATFMHRILYTDILYVSEAGPV